MYNNNDYYDDRSWSKGLTIHCVVSILTIRLLTTIATGTRHLCIYNMYILNDEIEL